MLPDPRHYHADVGVIALNGVQWEVVTRVRASSALVRTPFLGGSCTLPDSCFLVLMVCRQKPKNTSSQKTVMLLHCSVTRFHIPNERTDSKFGRFSQKCTKYTLQQFKIQFCIHNLQKPKNKYKRPCSVVNRKMVLTYRGGFVEQW